jgi:hypothetical protein
LNRPRVNDTTVICKNYEFCQTETHADLIHKHPILDFADQWSSTGVPRAGAATFREQRVYIKPYKLKF